METPTINLQDSLIFWKADLPQILRRTPRTIDRWISQNNFPEPTNYQGNRPYWSRKAISEWVES